MKKTYITPALRTMRISTEQLIATSMNVYSDQATGTNGGWVRGMHADLDVWDED